jgi:hypothetical protein
LPVQQIAFRTPNVGDFHIAFGGKMRRVGDLTDEELEEACAGCERLQ